MRIKVIKENGSVYTWDSKDKERFCIDCNKRITVNNYVPASFQCMNCVSKILKVIFK